ncbi:hypothetical protein ACIBSV_15360 [Embleya sp. NPDC050154]|uniref:hypothetical protein n=1 Tax=Embleya sp. NPDC050154 TaxID=3363988 RepID=UPI0037BDB6B0
MSTTIDTGLDTSRIDLPPRESPAPAAAPVAEETRSSGPATPTPHSPGGVPAVPALVVASNTTVGLVSSAAVVGGPYAIGLAVVAGVTATGAAASCAMNVRRERRAAEGRTAPARRERRAIKRAAAAATRHGRVGALSRLGMGGTPSTRRAGGKSGGTGGKSGGAGKAGGKRGSGAGLGGGAGRGPGAGKSVAGKAKSGTGPKPGPGSKPGAGSKSPGGKGPGAGHTGGRGAVSGKAAGARAGVARAAKAAAAKAGAAKGAVGAVKSARAAGSGGSRAERRRQVTAARRAHRDARRDSKAKSRQAAANSPTKRNRLTGAIGSRAARARSAWRARRDGRRENRIAAARGRAREAMARRALRRSAWRYRLRCAATALAVLPVGLLGVVSTEIGRRMGWTWLMYPGRRMWAGLTRRALHARLDRDVAIVAAHEAANEDDDEAAKVAPTVERPPRGASTDDDSSNNNKGDIQVSGNTGGFDLALMCEEIESAAGQYDPDGAMQVLAFLESLPTALHSFANVFKILAEKSDSELPLDPMVADVLGAIHGLLAGAADGAEDVPQVFRTVHAGDIRRHEEPRPGEDKWDTGNNN